jgi:hypothetical protein
MKTLRLLLGVCVGLLVSFVVAQAQDTKEYLEKLYSFYSSYQESGQHEYKEKCTTLYYSLPENTRAELDSLLLDRIAWAADLGKISNSSFIEEGERFLFITPDTFDGKEVVIEQLASIYEARQNTSALQLLLTQLKDIQETTGYDLSESIREVSDRYYNALKWETTEGYWVADQLFTLDDQRRIEGSFLQTIFDSSDREVGINYSNFAAPFLVLNVKPNEVEYVSEASGFIINPFKNTVFSAHSEMGVVYYGGRMKHSQVYTYDKTTRQFISYFANEELIDGNLKTSNDWLNLSQTTDAALKADLKTGDYSFSEKLGGAAVDGVMTAMMRNFAQRTAVTKKYADIISINGTRVKANVIDGRFSYKHIVSRNDSYNPTVRTPIHYEKTMKLYRVSGETGITLANKKGTPLLYFMSDTEELKRLRRKYSMANPAYLLSTIACAAGGVLLGMAAINDIKKYVDDKLPFGSYCKAFGAGFCLTFTLAIPFSLVPGARQNAVTEYNAKQMENLRSYYGND